MLLAIYLTIRFHAAVYLFINGSQMTLKCGDKEVVFKAQSIIVKTHGIWNLCFLSDQKKQIFVNGDAIYVSVLCRW